MNTFPDLWRKSDKFFLTVVAAGVLLRVIYIIEYSHFVNFDIASGADVREYFDRASEIIGGSFFPEKPDIHGIFYPLFLAPLLALTQSVAFVRCFQLILDLASFCGLYFLLGKYSVPLKVRRIFLLFAMLYTVRLFHTAELISESLLIPLITLVLTMFHLMRTRKTKELLYSSFAGVFTAFTILTHGAMLLLALLFAVMLFREKRKKCLLFFSATLIAVTGTFVLIKSVHYGKFCFVQANGGFNFYLGNSSGADGTCRIRPGLVWRRLHIEAEKEAEKLQISTDRLFIGKSLRYMAENPLKAAAGFCRKAMMFFHYKELISGADPVGLVYRTYSVRATKPFTLWLMLLSITGVMIALKKKEKIPDELFCLYVAVLAVNILTVTSGRYRYAAYPSIFLFAAYALTVIPAKVTVIFSVIFIAVPFFASYGNTLDDESHRILGEAAYRKGDHHAAFEHLTVIRQKNDDPSGVENMLGDIYSRNGNVQAARECFSRAIILEPERYEAYMNLAGMTKDIAEAAKLYRQAYERGGNKSGLLNINYAKFLLMLGKPHEAVNFSRQGVSLQPRNADAWNTLAVAYAYSGNIRLAADSFETASNLAPENAEYRKNLQAMTQELARRRQRRMQRMMQRK